MFKSLDVFQIANAMAVHAGQRQALIAQNVANSDTPGYKARDIADFAESYSAQPSFLSKATRAAHLTGARSAGTAESFELRGPASPNGNTVSIESEMLRAADTMRQHSRAMTIYKSALDVLRMNLSR